MKQLFLLAVLLLSFASIAEEFHQQTASKSGLSGFPFLPGNDVLQVGFLRIQGMLDYNNLQHGNSNIMLPVSITWGCIENLEIGGEVPFYLDDSSEEENFLGDISAGCSWLYETARGGTSLVLKGQLKLPTGVEGRDSGSELAMGVTSGTTFRLFRLHTSASYVLNGGNNPFSGPIIDYLRFSAGGASFITGDLQAICGVEGTTTGDLNLAATVTSYALDRTALFCTMRAGLSGSTEYSISAGIARTWGHN